MGPLYVGAQNDCLFIIDQPPRPSTDDIGPDRGVNIIAKIEPGLVPRAAEYARLFAAAPDLLTACEELIERLEYDDRRSTRAAVARAQLAVSRAKGE